MAIFHRAYHYRIYPNEKQREIFAKTFGACRFVYNKSLEYKKSQFDNFKRRLTKFDMLNYCTRELKSEFSWLREVDAIALLCAVKDMDFAYQMYFNSKTGFPKFKTKKDNIKTYSTAMNNNNIELIGNYLKLPKTGLVKVKVHRQPPQNGKIKKATIKKLASGKYSVYLVYEFEKEVAEVKPQTFIGLDFSMSKLFIDSNGNKAGLPRFYRTNEKLIAREKRKLDLMQPNSHNWEKQRIKLARVTERVTNSRNDFLHKQSRQIANAYDCVCIEDLNMRQLSKSLNFGKSVTDNAWGRFTKQLDYKLRELGKRLIKVDKFLPSTQCCNVCGSINKSAKALKVRKWICPECGAVHDRDTNAAVNIRNEGMRLIAEA